MAKQRKNVIGEKYGLLTIIDDADDYICPSGRHCRMVKCKCECGNDTVVQYSHIRSHSTISCGCQGHGNNYDLTSDIGICYLNTSDDCFYFDKDDYDKIKDYTWYYQGSQKMIYNKQAGWLHRFLMNCPDDMMVDHIDHNPLNNCKSNLRICTGAENNYNKIISKANTTGYKGVSYKSNKFEAQIYYQDSYIYLGRYDTAIEAAEAYNQAAIQYFGEYACLNELDK